MILLKYSKSRILSFCKEIDRIKDSDFPYKHSQDALAYIKNAAMEQKEILDSLGLDSDPTIIAAACFKSREVLSLNLPYLGFILRSTNVRNAFESYGPLLHLSQDFLGKETKLIISCEWEYAPYMYHGVPGLPSYILIGLPASESDNPLLLPLAGHELGHSAWTKHDLNNRYTKPLLQELQKLINQKKVEFNSEAPGIADLDELSTENIFTAEITDNMKKFAIWKCEESFCDFIGLKLFGESFLHAFAYLLTPGGSSESSTHPDINRRSSDLVTAAKSYGIAIPDGYLSLFDSLSPYKNKTKDLFASTAESAASSLVSVLIADVDKIISDSTVPIISEKEISLILSSFQKVVPAQNTGGLPNILVAGWRAFHDNALWKNEKRMKDKDRDLILKELMLKSIEVLEIEQITRQP